MKIFRLSTISMKINQIFYVIFQTTRQFFFKYSMTFQCHDTKLIFNILAQHYITWTKKSFKMQSLRFLSTPVKFTKVVTHVIYGTTSHFSFKVSLDLQYNEAKLLCTFLARILHILVKWGPLKSKF